MALDDPVIKLRWMKLCAQAFDQANLNRRSSVGAKMQVFPMDRVSLKNLVEELRALCVSFDPLKMAGEQ